MSRDRLENIDASESDGVHNIRTEPIDLTCMSSLQLAYAKASNAIGNCPN